MLNTSVLVQLYVACCFGSMSIAATSLQNVNDIGVGGMSVASTSLYANDVGVGSMLNASTSLYANAFGVGGMSIAATPPLYANAISGLLVALLFLLPCLAGI
jgi:hypothetical protein